ncbi:MAG TPA: DUF1996 domain-containing protein [Cellulomonas sp.]
MRSSMVKTLILSVVVLAAATTLVVTGRGGPAAAANGDPQFKVVCIPTRMAQDDPIVFPGQPGKSHMHTFFGARTVTASTTLTSLLADTWSACGSGFGLDKSGYWVPSLEENGQYQFASDESIQLAVYYKRAGGHAGVPVAQAIPQGLRMIAGDMMATTPQDDVWFKCADVNDSGNQSQLVKGFPSCGSNQHIIEELLFPDCWDGVHLDSANHKSHMAYSSGPAATCPADHPVKLPQITFEVWYHAVIGAAPSALALSSGDHGPYSLHGDVFSAWSSPQVAAALVNECLNAGNDCTPYSMSTIATDAALARVTQAQIDAQLHPAQSQPAPAAAGGGAGSPQASSPPASGHTHGSPATGAAPAPSAAAASQAPAAPTTAAGATTAPGDPTTSPGGAGGPSPTSSGGAPGIASGHAGHGDVLAATGSPGGSQPRPGWVAAAGLTTGGAALAGGSYLLWRRRPKLWRWQRPWA